MPLLRNPRLKPGSAFTWSKTGSILRLKFASGRFTFHWRELFRGSFSIINKDRSNSMMPRVIALGLTTLAWRSTMASAHAKPTGEFVQFQQQCPYPPEFESFLNHTVIRPVDNDRRGLENPFLGLICYVGSIAKTVWRIVTPNKPSRSGQRSTKFFGSPQSITGRLTAGDELGTELTTTGTYALRTLTFSPA